MALEPVCSFYHGSPPFVNIGRTAREVAQSEECWSYKPGMDLICPRLRVRVPPSLPLGENDDR